MASQYPEIHRAGVRAALRASALAGAFAVLAMLIAFALPAQGKEDVDCTMCHDGLVTGKTVHAAVQMGCPSCHSGINAEAIPHKKSGGAPKGLSAEQPDLCYGCHDKEKFSHKFVHAAVGMGCTGCHNPHSSKNEKLLVSPVPDLCQTCHDKAEFSRKNVHVPVAGGMCLTCHSPHASDQPSLLVKETAKVCIECHPDVPRRPHAISGFSATGHPLGLPKVSKQTKAEVPSAVKDPKRPDKLFSCSSCHNPHSSDSRRLYRYPGRSPMDLCSNCHKY